MDLPDVEDFLAKLGNTRLARFGLAISASDAQRLCHAQQNGLALFVSIRLAIGACGHWLSPIHLLARSSSSKDISSIEIEE